jgi:cytochrome c-type biogenesis protein CcmE
MKKNKRFLIGALIILAVLGYLVYGGMQEAIVYFVTPSELSAGTTTPERFLRVGGMVLAGSLEKDLAARTFHFEITDGKQSIPVEFKGVPPDLFAEGKGAVVEGRFGSDGVFRASLIMAKHAEEYGPHKEGEDPTTKRSFVPGQAANAP